MIPSLPRNSVTSFGIKNTLPFSIETEDAPHIVNILRNELYSNKILAFIREYSTNAQDANIENNCPERPIEVTLPTKLYPVFKVRDFGRGLTYEEMQDVYIKYGKSTKRNTNSQTGVFGIGSKSAFAYVNSFVITSYCNHKQIVCEAHVDNSNIDTLNLVSISDYEGSDTGMEISIPVKENDIDEVINTACSFYSYFSPRPVFKGDTTAISKYLENFDNRKIVLSADNWEIVQPEYKNNVNISAGVYAIINNAVYKFSLSDIDVLDMFGLCSKYAVFIRLPIGEATTTPSRESLQLNDETKKVLRNSVLDIQNNILKIIQTKINQSEDIWQAYDVITSYIIKRLICESDINKFTYREMSLPDLKALYKDTSLCVDLGNIIHQFNVDVRKYYMYSMRRDMNPTLVIPVSHRFLLLINKKDFPACQTKQRIKIAYEQYKAQNNITDDSVTVYILDFKDISESNIQNFLNYKSTKELLPVIDLSTIQCNEQITITKQSKNNIFVFDESTKQWIVTKDAIKSGYYIKLIDKNPRDDLFTTNIQFCQIIKFLRACNITIPQVYGIDASYVNNADVQLLPFGDFIKESITRAFTNQDIVNKYHDLLHEHEINLWCDRLSIIADSIDDDEFKHFLNNKDTCCFEFSSRPIYQAIIDKLHISVPPPVNSKYQRLEAIRKKYPLLEMTMLHTNAYSNIIETHKDDIIEYINITHARTIDTCSNNEFQTTTPSKIRDVYPMLYVALKASGRASDELYGKYEDVMCKYIEDINDIRMHCNK